MPFPGGPYSKISKTHRGIIQSFYVNLYASTGNTLNLLHKGLLQEHIGVSPFVLLKVPWHIKTAFFYHSKNGFTIPFGGVPIVGIYILHFCQQRGVVYPLKISFPTVIIWGAKRGFLPFAQPLGSCAIIYVPPPKQALHIFDQGTQQDCGSPKGALMGLHSQPIRRLGPSWEICPLLGPLLYFVETPL